MDNLFICVLGKETTTLYNLPNIPSNNLKQVDGTAANRTFEQNIEKTELL
jgi:hypothetical protein